MRLCVDDNDDGAISSPEFIELTGKTSSSTRNYSGPINGAEAASSSYPFSAPSESNKAKYAHPFVEIGSEENDISFDLL